MAITSDFPFRPESKKGIIYLVGTPIGNMSDISERAKAVLAAADLIACEDTRVSSSLLSRLGIKGKPLISAFAQKELKEAQRLVAEVSQKKLMLAYISDAGMPGISDPGALLIKEAISHGVSVSSVPGPTAFVSALLLSGFDTAAFSFYGFLPSKQSQRLRKLKDIKDRPETIVFYEAPHRLRKTLADIAAVFGSSRQLCLGRELTKAYEEYIRGTAGELSLLDDARIRGEFVIVCQGQPAPERCRISDDQIQKEAVSLIAQGKHKSEAAAIIAEEYGVGKNLVYKLLSGKA